MSPQGQSIDEVALEPGTFPIRAVAHLIDLVAFFVVVAISGFAAGIAVIVLEFFGKVTPGAIKSLGDSSMTTVVLCLGLPLYNTLAVWLGGASLGKVICGLRVLSEERRPTSLGQALIRSLALYVDSMFLGIVGQQAMASSSRRQRYGDRWAHTIVVRTRSLPEHARSKPALGIFTGLFALAVVLFVTLVLGALF